MKINDKMLYFAYVKKAVNMLTNFVAKRAAIKHFI
jgi:hypothetical protein